jgi:SprT protein
MNLYNQTMLSVAKHTDPIEPISIQQREEVSKITLEYIALASKTYKKSFLLIPIIFDLRGKCAGMYRRNGRERVIRFNPWLFAKYYQHSLEQTIPHEVAHYITDCLFPFRRVKPHGKEWRSVMQAFGVEAKVTGDFDLTGIPVKQYQRIDYICGCKTHQLSLIRHRRVQSGQAEYRCKDCRQLLKVASK